MWYGYKLNEQQDWVKMKTFDTLEEYKKYVESHRVTHAMCSNKEIDLRGKALLTWQEKN